MTVSGYSAQLYCWGLLQAHIQDRLASDISSAETPELAHSWWPVVLSRPIHSVKVSGFC